VIIEVQNFQKVIPLKPSQISAIARKILRLQRINQAWLSIAIVTDRKIQALNRRYLGRDHATDVLAFDLRDRGILPQKSSKLVGEIIISADTARRNAKVFQGTPYAEVVLCLTHGILHLVGYDDQKIPDQRKMSQREQAIVKQVIKSPPQPDHR